MKKNNKKRVIYYSDLLNDDFAGTNIKHKAVDNNYKYVHKNIIWRFFSFILYYVIAMPIVWFYDKICLRVKFVNKKALKKVKNSYFLFGNHTSYNDAFTPNLLSLPKRNRIMVSADTISIKGIKTLVEMLGATPVPTELSGMKNYKNAIEYYYNKKYSITIFPEAHIWPYYTKVRPFKDTSFGYPVMLNSPVFAFFTAYSEPKGLFKSFRKANITVYISEPFYPNQNLSRKESQKELRDKVYNFMVECSNKYSTYEAVEYIKKDKENKNIL